MTFNELSLIFKGIPGNPPPDPTSTITLLLRSTAFDKAKESSK